MSITRVTMSLAMGSLLTLMACTATQLDDLPEDGVEDTNVVPGDDDDDTTNPAGDVDSDGDGLTDAEEDELGTDKDNPDTDGDGYLDGEEVLGNTNPNNADDHPYQAGWTIDACRNDVQHEGNQLGQVAQDFTLLSQYGEDVTLSDFCDDVVLLVGSASWCGPCQAEAPELAGWFDDHEQQDLMVITLLGENIYGQTPSRADLQEWAQSFGIHHPVLADSNFQVTARFIDGNQIALPTMQLLDRGLVIQVRDGWVSEGQVEQLLMP